MDHIPGPRWRERVLDSSDLFCMLRFPSRVCMPMPQELPPDWQIGSDLFREMIECVDVPEWTANDMGSAYVPKLGLIKMKKIDFERWCPFVIQTCLWHIDAKPEIARGANGPQSRKKRTTQRAPQRQRQRVRERQRQHRSDRALVARAVVEFVGLVVICRLLLEPQSRDRMNRSRGLNPLVSECRCLAKFLQLLQLSQLAD